MQNLTLSLVQAPLEWHDPASNRQVLGQLLDSTLKDGPRADLIVLPEMFTTGFTMEAATQAETTEGPTLAWMREYAARHQAVLTGSVLIKEGDHYYNRLLWVRPDGTHSSYDKRHLFRLAGEHEVFTAGSTRLVEEWRGWRIMPLVCYDLRFPVWSRNRPDTPYDLLVYVANWPESRIDAWKALLRARAIENVAYVAGVNRLGNDGHGHSHPGQSVVLDMEGNALAQAGTMYTVISRTLRAEDLDRYRQRMSFLQDADEFTMPDQLG